jgi:hypothetical protein
VEKEEEEGCNLQEALREKEKIWNQIIGETKRN